MKRIECTLLGILLGLSCLLIGSLAFAEEMPFRSDCAAVLLNDAWQDYDLQINEYAYCPIALTANGRLDITVQTAFDHLHYVYLLDENYETVNYASVYGNGAASPINTAFSYDLTAGTYYIRVESWNDCCGAFRIRAAFAPSAAPTAGGGSSFQTAVPYSPAAITGFLSSATTGEWVSDPLPAKSQNLEDYFKFDAQAGVYAICLTTADPEGRVCCEIYNASYQKLDSTIYSGDSAASIQLEDGTYYARVMAQGDRCGDYLLKIEAE